MLVVVGVVEVVAVVNLKAVSKCCCDFLKLKLCLVVVMGGQDVGTPALPLVLVALIVEQSPVPVRVWFGMFQSSVEGAAVVEQLV